MNPIGDEDNIFSSLFDKVPAKRAGNESDMAGTVLYATSRAGVSCSTPAVTLFKVLMLESIGLCRRCVAVCRWWPYLACQWTGISLIITPVHLLIHNRKLCLIT